MKNTIFKGILALVMAFMALPMMGQDYLKIYFKDGHSERHFMHHVDNISVTKYDLEGNLHNDYQMQQIIMKDTTYSYYLSDIDKMSFNKVDEEQLKKRVASVQSALEPFIQQCSSVEDFASHIEEIKSINGVENVYSEGTDFVIQILDWFEIRFTNQPMPNKSLSSLNSLPKKDVKQLMPISKDESPFDVTIGFQMVTDTKWSDEKERIDELCEDFKSMDYQPNLYLGKEMDMDFFYKHIFDSNLLFIDTHGGCGIFNKKHYLYTGIEAKYAWAAMVGVAELRALGIDVNNIDLDDVGITCCSHDDGGWFGEKWYWMVKEDYIHKSPYRFTGTGPHIVFIGSCSSLEGNDILTRSDGVQLYGNDSFAQVFFDKGADVYLGYNRGTARATGAGASFFDYMMHGASVEQAFQKLHPLYKYESDTEEKAYLVDLYKNDSESKKLFIVNTKTEEKTEQEFFNEYKNTGQVELRGETAVSAKNHQENYDYLHFGFKIAKQPKVDDLANGEEISAHNTDTQTGEVTFSAMFTPTPGETYFYRAFTYDGIHYNWGEEKSFTISQLTVSTNYLSLEVGWTRTVNITSGSGSYVIESSDEHVATAFVDGSTISVNALNVGESTITVSDKVTGQTATILVTVTGQADTRELMITKTVNKTVYSIYKKTLDENDYRTIPDGWKCYRSELILDIIKDGKTESYVVDNNIYLDKQDSHHGGQQPCMLLDFNKNMIGIFCNPKGSGYNYEMDGYFYSSSMDNVNFSKETVFEGANWGWFPYFRDYGDDNIYLCNFSYGGYFTILAVRENGSWELYYDNDDISPEAAEQIWKRIGSVLVIGNTQDEDVDDRIHTVIPEEIRDEIEEYIPIYDGMNPPNIEDAYFLSPQILIGSSRSFDYIGSEYAYEYQKYSNQDMANNTIDMVRVQGDGIEWAKGSGAFISGTGNNFTIYFIMEGESDGIWTKEAYIVSGTKTASGIKDLTCGFILTEKGDDPDGRLVDVGTFRFFTDQDGMSETTSWPYGTQYGTRKRVKENSDRPNSHEKSHATLKHLKKP